MAENFYRVLEVDRHCSAEDIKKSFQRLAKKVLFVLTGLHSKLHLLYNNNCWLFSQYHPDRLPPEASQSERDAAVREFHKISQAYKALSDENTKSDYDTALDGKLGAVIY